MTEPTVKPFDFDLALREIAVFRQRRDEPATAQTQVADRIASRAAVEFGPEAVETAGLGMLLGAGMLAELIRNDLENPTVLVNILSLIGERLVRDGRTFGGVA